MVTYDVRDSVYRRHRRIKARWIITEIERKCDHPGCTVILITQADNTRCRRHRNYAGRCCGDKACQYGSRRVF